MRIDINGSDPYFLLFCVLLLMVMPKETIWLSRSGEGDIDFRREGMLPSSLLP